MKKLCILLAALIISACAASCDKNRNNDGDDSTGGETVTYQEVDIPDSDYKTPAGSDFQTKENDDGTLTVMLYLGKDTALKIPTEIDGKKVTKIGNSAFKGSILQGIKLPDTVTEIDSLAFHSCSSLVEVELNEGLVTIGNAAFFNCVSLYEIDFPSTLESIGDNCFYSTPWLYLQRQKDEDFIIVGDGYLFAYKGNKAKVEIPDTVRIIGSYSFYEYTDLKTVKVPDSVEIIGERAFYLCSTLHTIELGKNVRRIGKEALFDCTKLTSLTLPASVTELDYRSIGYYTDMESMPAVNPALTVTCSSAQAKDYMEENGVAYKTQ